MKEGGGGQKRPEHGTDMRQSTTYCHTYVLYVTLTHPLRNLQSETGS